MHGSKTILGVVWRQRLVEVREGKASWHFGYWAHVEDGCIVAAFICRFVGFRDGEDKSLHPDLGIWTLETERLKMYIRKLMPTGSRCLRWR